MSAEWLGALTTIVLAGLTFYYVRLTHNLLKIQVEPRVEVSIAPETRELILRNCGAYPVWDVSVEYNVRALPGPVERYGKTAKLPLIAKLRAGKLHKIPVDDAGVSAVEMLKQVEQTRSSNDMPAQTWVRFSLSWQRILIAESFRRYSFSRLSRTQRRADRASGLRLHRTRCSTDFGSPRGRPLKKPKRSDLQPCAVLELFYQSRRVLTGSKKPLILMG